MFHPYYILVAEQGRTVVGTGALVGSEILGVFVDPRCQGQGYGRALMNALEGRAAKNGVRMVQLCISLPSKGFYKNMGYRVGRQRSFDVGRGQRLRFWKASKALQQP